MPKKQIETNKTKLHYVNTLTYDTHNPLTCGFCLSYGGAGEDIKLVEHNGFKNLKAEDVDAFRRIADMLEVIYKLKGDDYLEEMNNA